MGVACTECAGFVQCCHSVGNPRPVSLSLSLSLFSLCFFSFSLAFLQIRSVCEDRFPAIRNAIPPPLQYPSKGWGPEFAQGLILMTYSPGVLSKIGGVIKLIKAALFTFTRPKSD